MKPWLLLPVVAAVGFAAGRWWPARPDDLARRLDRQDEKLDRLLAREPAAPAGGLVWRASPAPDEHALREAVREELAAARPVPAPVEPSPESVQAAEEARTLVQAAIAARRWTEDDAQKLRARLPLLTGEQRNDVVLPLAQAINRQEMALEVNGPPF